jgi:hypothetical protein
MRRILAASFVGLALTLIGAGHASADSIVNVAMLGSGYGRVADVNTMGGIDCPGQCSADYVRYFKFQDVLTLSASPNDFSYFSGWGGACGGTQPTCGIAAFSDATKAATARFERLPIFGVTGLTVSVAGAGAGTVTGPGVACPADCSQNYLKDAAVELIAAPAPGSSFAGWSGACSGALPTCNLTMDGARTITALFSAAPVQDDAPTESPTPTGPTGSPGRAARCTVLGTAGADVLTGTPRRDVICGRGGNDTLIGRASADTLIGGAGADLLRGGRGRDVLYARDRREDRLNGGPGTDRARIDIRKDARKSVELLF